MNTTPPHQQVLLVSSRSDPAGSLIHEEVHAILNEIPSLHDIYLHRQFDERLIYLDGKSLISSASVIIFLSRHASVDSRAILTVHVTGNFGPADYGGDKGTLTPAATVMMHAIINRLAADPPAGYEVSYEATHHGPTSVPVPSMFVEVGSTETQWYDRTAAAAVARAVVGAGAGDVIRLAGFGGTHYAKRQTEIALTTRGGFGHIMPSRDLIHLNKKMFADIISGSDAEAVYIDKKSISKKDISLIEGFAQEWGIPVVSQSDLIQVKNIPFPEYLQVVRLAQSCFPGAVVDTHGLTDAGDPALVSVQKDLITIAAKEDPRALKAGLDLMPVARISGGGVAFCPTFITNRKVLSKISDDLIHLCVSIIKSRCDCRFEGDCLIITGQKFDTEKARVLGVPAGPAYGRLMAGEVVEVLNSVITPAMVMSTTEKWICIPGWGMK
jgi:D-aminoacyl-tRNA deacylase